jgi:hypothetical protein
MRLATLKNGKADGELVVVSRDGDNYLSAPGLTLLSAIEDWDAAEPMLRRMSALVEQGAGGSWIIPACWRRCRAHGNGWMARPSRSMAR